MELIDGRFDWRILGEVKRGKTLKNLVAE